LHEAVHVLAEITFPFYLRVILIWTDDTYFLFLNFSFFLFLIRELLMCPLPFFFLDFDRSLILNWISTCWWSLFRVFLKEILFFRLKEGAMEFHWCFRMNKHGHISFWIMIAWFLERLTLQQILTIPNTCHFSSFFFHRPIFCLDCPLLVFNLTDLYFFFLLIFFLVSLAKRTWDS